MEGLLLLHLPTPLFRVASAAPTMRIAPFVPDTRRLPSLSCLSRPSGVRSSSVACRVCSRFLRASSWASRFACNFSATCFPLSSPLSFAAALARSLSSCSLALLISRAFAPSIPFSCFVCSFLPTLICASPLQLAPPSPRDCSSSRLLPPLAPPACPTPAPCAANAVTPALGGTLAAAAAAAAAASPSEEVGFLEVAVTLAEAIMLAAFFISWSPSAKTGPAFTTPPGVWPFSLPAAVSMIGAANPSDDEGRRAEFDVAARSCPCTAVRDVPGAELAAGVPRAPTSAE